MTTNDEYIDNIIFSDKWNNIGDYRRIDIAIEILRSVDIRLLETKFKEKYISMINEDRNVTTSKG